ncbi:MAG: 5-oxoprolinase subunit PxpA [Candidatus Eremiobacteraeota bacterium]|nr:5-oxoprolinase subunit PxpA [Candidatus Eremiobacteraeota bacterium]MBC5828418.1 5-oxoprolinase subunit PxpA [Candidatus Eremiobacteraeota bacterium]
MRKVDLNADVGESFGAWKLGADGTLLSVVTSANIACGFHAGDPSVMEATVRQAVAHGVAVGAHPGYPDLAGFGRRAMEIPVDEVVSIVLYQIGALNALARAHDAKLSHVKPHGALYNDAAKDESLAAAVATAIARFDRGLTFVGLAGSAMKDAARNAGLRFAGEAFCDRVYRGDGTLAPRAEGGAMQLDPDAAARQATDIVVRRKVSTASGEEIDVEADTLCIHGDTAQAPAIACAVREALLRAHVAIVAL